MAARRPHWTFWLATPVCFLSLLALGLLPWHDLNFKKIAVAVCWVAWCVLPPFALYDSRRFWWATRTLTAMIFLAYSSYFIYEWFFPGQRLGSGAMSSPEKSLVGLFVFALPALWYTIFGRLTLRKPTSGSDDT